MSKPYAWWKAECRAHKRALGASMAHFAFVGDPSGVKVSCHRPSAPSLWQRQAMRWAAWKAYRDHGAPTDMVGWKATISGRVVTLVPPKGDSMKITVPSWE